MSTRTGAGSEFVAYIQEVFEGFGPIEAKRIEYTKQGKRTQISYYMAPAEIFDDPDAAKRWADRAYAVALGAKQR